MKIRRTNYPYRARCFTQLISGSRSPLKRGAEENFPYFDFWALTIASQTHPYSLVSWNTAWTKQGQFRWVSDAENLCRSTKYDCFRDILQFRKQHHDAIPKTTSWCNAKVRVDLDCSGDDLIVFTGHRNGGGRRLERNDSSVAGAEIRIHQAEPAGRSRWTVKWKKEPAFDPCKEV